MDFLTAWRGRRVLVTGGTGFIGRQVMSLGVKAGVEIHNLSSQSDDGASDEAIYHHVVDLRDGQRVREVVTEIAPQGILHLAAGGVRNRESTLSDLLAINTIGLQTLLDSAANMPLPPPVVIAGSWFEYAPQTRPLTEDDPLCVWSAYTASKVAANAIAEYYAMQFPVTVLRLFSVYGSGEPLTRLIPYIIQTAHARSLGEQRTIALTGCKQVRDYVYVTDAARAFWHGLHYSPQKPVYRVFNVGTGRPLVLREFVESLTRLLAARGLPAEIEFGAKPYNAHEAMHAVADISRIENELQWQAQTSLQDGLETMITVHLDKQVSHDE